MLCESRDKVLVRRYYDVLTAQGVACEIRHYTGQALYSPGDDDENAVAERQAARMAGVHGIHVEDLVIFRRVLAAVGQEAITEAALPGFAERLSVALAAPVIGGEVAMPGTEEAISARHARREAINAEVAAAHAVVAANEPDVRKRYDWAYRNMTGGANLISLLPTALAERGGESHGLLVDDVARGVRR